jgi:hypothetical protein
VSSPKRRAFTGEAAADQEIAAHEYALIAEPRKSFSSFVYVFGVNVNNLDGCVCRETLL